MASRLKKVVISGFDGGLHSINKGKKAQPNQLIEADNVIILENGEIRKRMGVTDDATIATSTMIDGICRPFHLRRDTGVCQIRNAAGTILFTSANNVKGDFLNVDSKYIYSNGVDVMQVWAVADVVTAAVFGSPPLSRFLYKHNNRCFAATDNQLYETEVDRYPDAAVDYFATGASWKIGDSTTKITGIGSIGRDLIIFKERSIWLQTGYTVNERQNSIMIDRIGCVSPDTIKSVNLQGAGEGLIFLAHTGKLYFLGLSGLIEIGEAVQDKLDAIHYGTAVGEVALSSNMHRAVAGVVPEGYYLLGYADAATDTYETWDKCLCVHLNKIYPSQFGGNKPAITLFKYLDYSHATVHSSYNCFSCFGDPQKNSYTDKLAMVCRSMVVATLYHSIGDIEMSEFRDKDYNGNYLETCDRIKLAYIDVGEPYYLKNWVEAVMYVSKHDNTGLTAMMFTQLYDEDLTAAANDDVQITMNLTNEYVTDIPVNLGDDYSKISMDLSIYTVPYFAGPNPMDLRIHSIEIFFKPSSQKVSTSPRYV